MVCAQHNQDWSVMTIPQEVLDQPTRDFDGGEETTAWRARYRTAHQALMTHLRALPSAVFTKDSTPDWVGDPNVITSFEENEIRVPSFQLGTDGSPIELVQAVNFRLALRYRDGSVPWASPRIAQFVWWLKTHQELGVAPIELLGTDRESQLIDLATDPATLR